MVDTNDSNAPWNQKEPTPVGFMKVAIVTLSKEVELETIAYEDHIDCDGNGYFSEIPGETDWEQEFKDEHRTIPQLLEILEKRSEKELNGLKRFIKHIERHNGEVPAHILAKMRELESIIKDCRGWRVEDIEIDDV